MRDKGTITLPFFVRSSTGLPAQIVGLRDRGYVREGQVADLVIFDYEEVQDHATITNPGGGNDGIEYVFVNGEAVVDRGLVTGALPGMELRRGGVEEGVIDGADEAIAVTSKLERAIGSRTLSQCRGSGR